MTAKYRWALTALLLVPAAAFAQAKGKAPAPGLPEILRPLGVTLGHHYAFKSVPSVSLKADTSPTADQWEAVGRLNRKYYALQGKGIDDDAVARLVSLSPEGLYFHQTRITDACFSSLAEMKFLKVLHFFQCKIHGKGAGLSELQSLDSPPSANSRN